MTMEDIKTILDKHAKWLLGQEDGERADLRGAILRGANMRGADMRGADMRGAILCDAILRDTLLCGAILRGAILRDTVLCGADMSGADMRGADMSDANMRGAILRGANMRGAILRGANMRDADMRDADGIPLACPENGAFTAFKKANKMIVELLIPEDARRSSATGRKCRCDKATVVSIANLDWSESGVKSVKSDYDSNFVYTVGESVSVDNFDDDRWNECAPGIHFYITRQEAVDY